MLRCLPNSQSEMVGRFFATRCLVIIKWSRLTSLHILKPQPLSIGIVVLYPEKIPKDIPTLTYLRSLLIGCFQAVSGLGNTMMEEILHHLGCIKPCNQWDNSLSPGTGFLPSTVVKIVKQLQAQKFSNQQKQLISTTATTRGDSNWNLVGLFLETSQYYCLVLNRTKQLAIQYPRRLWRFFKTAGIF